MLQLTDFGAATYLDIVAPIFDRFHLDKLNTDVTISRKIGMDQLGPVAEFCASTGHNRFYDCAHLLGGAG